jgi:hypothetical protein
MGRMGLRYEKMGWVRGTGISGVRCRRALGATLEGRKDGGTNGTRVRGQYTKLNFKNGNLLCSIDNEKDILLECPFLIPAGAFQDMCSIPDVAITSKVEGKSYN